MLKGDRRFSEKYNMEINVKSFFYEILLKNAVEYCIV